MEGTRVFLEDILEAYERGLSPEEMVLAFPSLRLADVYAVLAYAFAHPEEVAAYRKRQEARAREGVNPFAKGKPPGSRPGAWRPRPQGLAYQGPQ